MIAPERTLSNRPSDAILHSVNSLEALMIDTRTAPYAALLLRLSLGVSFLAHGLLLKVLTFSIPGTVGYFQSLGYPGYFAYLVMLGEIGGGLALVLGGAPRATWRCSS